MRYLMEKLSDIFYLQRYMFVNFLSWLMAGLKLILSLHYLACGWIYIHFLKLEAGRITVEFSDDSFLAMYVDSLYLMTTTISTVGYGDFKAFMGNTGDYTIEMIYLYFVTLYGIALFSSVTSEIFSYKKLEKVNEIARKRATDIEVFLYAVSKRRKDASLTDAMFKRTKEYI